MVGELLARIVALLFYSVCQGIVPAGAEQIGWDNVTGWHMASVAVIDYGFFPVNAGEVWIGWSLPGREWILFGTTEPPVLFSDDWHAECWGWRYAGLP